MKTVTKSAAFNMDEIDTIFLDMDGVVASFDIAWCRWFGYDFAPSDKWLFYERYGLTAKQFVQGLDGLPKKFWADLPLEEGADELFNWALRQGKEVIFLTHACTQASTDGKMEWIEKHYPDTKMIGVTESLDKKMYAACNTLLIDDKVETVEAFIEMGGRGRVWPKPYNHFQSYILGHIYFNKELLDVTN